MRGLFACLCVPFVSVFGLAQEPPKEITNSIGMKLVMIPKGTFMMGSPESEEGRFKIEVQHEVTISSDYYLGIFEVTQSQYKRVMGLNPSHFQGALVDGLNADLPVESVTWLDAVEFCKKLSELGEEKKDGRLYRLPTEAEWEYACRAGSTTAYSFDEETALLSMCGWFRDNSSNRTHTVGLLEPNAWGLYDMHGNVWEWCSDWFGEYPTGAVADPVGPNEGSHRILRGASWGFGDEACRSAVRLKSLPSVGNYNVGFRVALNSPDISK